MRLKELIIKGFKSFVDETKLQFDGLVAIVGPNGCGKSNIVDAIIWAMGEGSPKHLRSSQMADVVFNGSGTRKPLNQASVELIFDNSQGMIGGQYAGYSEIAVKREVNRDGLSHYYFNGSRCRRRDIVELFLGTGLGSQGYSVIGQNQVHQFTEAKPDELRAFLEEAAGISIYKKRRHETNLRILHTNENLARVNDILLELNKQLQKLEKQAKQAALYKEYQAEAQRLQTIVLTCKWVNIEADLITQQQRVQQAMVALEEQQSYKTTNDAQMEAVYLQQTQTNIQLQDKQELYYSHNQQVLQQEQHLEYEQQRRAGWEAALTTITEQLERLTTELAQDVLTEQQLLTECTEVSSKHTQLAEQLAATEAVYAVKLQAVQQWHEAFLLLQQTVHGLHKDAETTKIRLEELERKMYDTERRCERLALEKKGLQDPVLEQQLSAVKEQVAVTTQLLEEQRHTIASLRSNAARLQQQITEQEAAIHTLMHEKQQLQAEQAAFLALQTAALAEDNQETAAWLGEHALTSQPRLLQCLSVAPKWQTAVEFVLSHLLEAVCVDAETFRAMCAAPAMAPGVQLLTAAASHTLVITERHLLSQCQSQPPHLAVSLLQEIYIADTLTEAQQLLLQLPEISSVLTADGRWISRYWCRSIAVKAKYQGALGCEQALANIQRQLQGLEEKLLLLQQQLQANKAELLENTGLQHTAQSVERELQQQLQAATTEQSALQTKHHYLQERFTQVQTELGQLQAQQTAWVTDVGDLRLQLETVLQQMETEQQKQATEQSQKTLLETELQAVQMTLQEQRAAVQTAMVQQQTIAAKQQALTVAMTRLRKQQTELIEQQTKIQTDLAAQKLPLQELRTALAVAVAERTTSEQAVAAVRVQLQEIEQELQQLLQQKQLLEPVITQLRTALEGERLELQTTLTKQEGIRQEFLQQQQLTEVVELEAVIAHVRHTITTEDPIGLQLTAQQALLEKVNNKILNLGAINLAAIEEHTLESERKGYLETQYQDLQQALAVLEEAMKTIDAESKQKFQETFDAVNSNFKTLFPKLFGGGRAELSLIGDDILTMGVGVLAQPPGKRNSSIHLLSGGEKALTAVALVFAIFQLNPAPFCILDEVDAPLDDANVGRFCQLIQEMSTVVQFMFITHNKLTMSIGTQLVGVTMKEPGVSRLVAVDINKAVAMVEQS
jgi:chromosome segregation protein